MTPYLKIIKFCYEHQYQDLTRKEVQSLLKIKKWTATRIMKEIIQENPILFELCQINNVGINSSYYLKIKDINRLIQEYKKYFN